MDNDLTTIEPLAAEEAAGVDPARDAAADRAAASRAARRRAAILAGMTVGAVAVVALGDGATTVSSIIL
jgi:hypothetical protein